MEGDNTAAKGADSLTPETRKDPPVAKEQDVNPCSVTGEVGEDGHVKPIDYNKLVEQFGTKLIDDALLERFKRVTGHKPHRFLRRRIVFSHRDLELILDKQERGEPFFIYTGRGPSSDIMHIGHVIPFELTKWLSDVFDVPLIIMLTDDEKYLIGGNEWKVEEYEHFARENAKDIVAVGFNLDRTFIFSDYGGTADACFGFDASTKIGKAHFAADQAASSFATSFPFLFGPNADQASKVPCLIPCAVDQDPYFRLTRDVANQLGFAKPCLIHARFLDALQGPGSKMSASVESSSVLLRDSPKTISTKIKQYAFSGGQETLEQHRALGGDPDVDVSYQYLRFFLEDDDELEQIRGRYRSGEMTAGEMKTKCVDEITKFCSSFQERRSRVTDEELDRFMEPRPLLCRGVMSDTVLATLGDKSARSGEGGPIKDLKSKNQAKKKEKMLRKEEKKSQKATERDQS